MAEEVEMTPIGADELPPKATPFGAASTPTPAASAPAPGPAAPVMAQKTAPGTVSTIRLKPVIRKPVIRKPGEMPAAAPKPAAASPKPAPALSKTQSLKSITGPIPAQATLRKTGIIAEGILTPAQQQAAKSKTSRISLESAIGVAPTASKGPAPLKTIRLRRPTDLNKPPAPSPFASLKPADQASSPAPSAAAAHAPEASAAGGETDADVTQKKTLKLHRPGVTLKRPAIGGVGGADAFGGGADLGGDVPELKPLDAADFGVAAPAAESAGVPGWLMAMTTLTSIAALLVLGAVFYFLFTEGCAPVAGENYTAFIAL